jgi:hypothetical protein
VTFAVGMALAAGLALATTGALAQEPAPSPSAAAAGVEQAAPAATPAAAPAPTPSPAPAAPPPDATSPPAPAAASTPAPPATPATTPAAARATPPAPAAAASAAPAETLYVVEQLAVAVNSAPDASGERIATVKSGDRLEVIERQHDQVRVRLGGGREGWVRASYLTRDEPLKQRLAQRDTELAQLREQLSTLQAQLGAGRSATTTRNSPAPGAASEDSGEPPAGALFATSDEPRRVWPWALGAWLAGLGLGGVLGALVLDRHIRRKFGGLRIY